MKTFAGWILALLFVTPAAADWEKLASMPTARSEMSAVVWEDRIYVPGGLGGTRAFEVYDTREKRWLSLAPLPEGRHHIAIAAWRGKIYVFGGADSSWRASKSTFIYDIASDRWSRGPEMPAVRYAAAAVVLGPHIYVVGGDGPGGNTLRYDPAGKTWRTLTPNRHRREHTSAVALGDKILIVGGRWSGVGELASTEIFDPRTGRWDYGPELAAARGGFTAVIHRGRVHAFGGEVIMNGSETLASVEVLRDDGWRPSQALPLGLHGVPVVSHGGWVYVLGGSQRAGAIMNDGGVYRSSNY